MEQDSCNSTCNLSKVWKEDKQVYISKLYNFKGRKITLFIRKIKLYENEELEVNYKIKSNLEQSERYKKRFASRNSCQWDANTCFLQEWYSSVASPHWVIVFIISWMHPKRSKIWNWNFHSHWNSPNGLNVESGRMNIITKQEHFQTENWEKKEFGTCENFTGIFRKSVPLFFKISRKG